MSRRSSRRQTKKALSLSARVSSGLTSLVEGNEATIASMMSITLPPATEDDDNTSQSSRRDKDRKLLMDALTDVMAVNNLTSEALLARFFDSSILSKYCERRMGVSGKGNEATLAVRIAAKWAKEDFEALPLVVTKKAEGQEEGGRMKRQSHAEDTKCKKRLNKGPGVLSEEKKRQKKSKDTDGSK